MIIIETKSYHIISLLSTLILVSLSYCDESFENKKRAQTPSNTCKIIVETFASATSNYTLCSLRNARPITLCQECVREYIQVKKSHRVFKETIDEEGNICQDYFTNLDRLQIVSEAYKYVHHLWVKANCDSCFKRNENGSLTASPTDETQEFNDVYRQTKDCFKDHESDINDTCIDCKDEYETLSEIYNDIEDAYRDHICMDLVDTMNITRDMWSEKYKCTVWNEVNIWLHVSLGLLALVPILFYSLAGFLSNRQESPVLHQKRLREEVFGVNSNSGSYGERVSSDQRRS